MNRDLRRFILFGSIHILTCLMWIGLQNVIDGDVIARNSNIVINIILSYFIMDYLDLRVFKD